MTAYSTLGARAANSALVDLDILAGVGATSAGHHGAAGRVESNGPRHTTAQERSGSRESGLAHAREGAGVLEQGLSGLTGLEAAPRFEALETSWCALQEPQLGSSMSSSMESFSSGSESLVGLICEGDGDGRRGVSKREAKLFSIADDVSSALSQPMQLDTACWFPVEAPYVTDVAGSGGDWLAASAR